MARNKTCVLTDNKICTDCGECDRCDLDPNKICDNCCVCIDGGKMFNTLKIDKIVKPPQSPKKVFKLKK